MPGLNAQYLSRRILDSLGFQSLGEDVLVHSTVIIANCENITLGSRIRIDPYVIISANGGVVIGNNVHIAAQCTLTGGAAIDLGDFSGLSQGVHIFTSSDDYKGDALTNPTVPASFKLVRTEAIRVGRHAIVGAGTVILPGADIGEGTAVGALTLVNQPLDPWSIYAGTPARRVGTRRNSVTAQEDLYAASRAEDESR